MEKRPIPEAETQAHKCKRELDALVGVTAARLANGNGNDATRQFRSDFSCLALAHPAPDWHKLPLPHANDGFAPFRTEAIPRNLPRGPLLRMARLLGIGPLRYLLKLGTENYQDQYRLVLRERQDNEYQRGNHYKRYGKLAGLIWFGNEVLRLERETEPTRAEALTFAAEAAGARANLRTLERRFQHFKKHCLQIGYVPSPIEGRSPIYSLSELDGR